MADRALLTTDGSDEANDALVRGLALINADVSIAIATSVSLPDAADAMGVGGWAGPTMTADQINEEIAVAKESGRSTIDSLLAKLPRKPESVHVMEGDAGQAICALASEIGADVIIMGSRGRGGIKRALLGSVSDYVVRHAPCPVLIVRNELALGDGGD